MAERRMFAKTIIDSDAFLDMPLSTQCLYFHLSMRADDEGFVNNPKKIQRVIGASEDDLKLLIAKSFLIQFETGVVVIKHWKIHNYIRGDRLVPTNYSDERALLYVKDNGAYTIDDIDVLTDICQTLDGETAAQVRLGKDRLVKDRLGEVSTGKVKKEPPCYFPTDEKLNEAFNRFIEHRKKLKKPMDEYKCELAVNKLNKLSSGDNDLAIAIIEQSISEGWQGLFELKKPKEKPQSIADKWANA